MYIREITTLRAVFFVIVFVQYNLTPWKGYPTLRTFTTCRETL